MVQALVDETFARFKQVVADGRARAARENKGRGRTLAKSWQEYADGRVLSGTQAYQLGFVDELGSFRTAVNRAKNLTGIEGKANLIEYRQRVDISDLFHLFGKTRVPAIKVDLGLDMPKLDAGRLYFLPPAFVN